MHRALACVLGHAVDSGDLYFQLRRAESWALEDGQVKNASHAIQQGVGVRAVSGEKTGFAYSDEIVLPALLEAATAARAIACHGGDGQLQVWRSAQRAGVCTSRSIRWKLCRRRPRCNCWNGWTPKPAARTRA